jgi:tetratricopeptide (TPR) repeat protein
MYYFAREYDCAIEHYQAALDLDAKFVFAHIWLGHVYEQQGRFEEALAELKTGVDLSDESAYALARLGLGYGVAGRAEEACAVLKKLETAAEKRFVSAYDLALVHLGLQERNEALTCLEHAFEQRSLWLGYLKVEPYLDPLRSEVRFEELLYGGLKLPGGKSSRPASSDRLFPG